MRRYLLSACSAQALQRAIDLTVTHFGTGLYGVPFAVAKEKGWFKSEAKLDVTGFITSAGGGTTIRNALASDIPYGEVALPAAIAAIQQGVELTIVHGGVLSVADQVWITRKDDESIKKFSDLKGKKLGYSSPKSVTDILTSMMIDANGLTGALERKSVGGHRLGADRAARRRRRHDLCDRAGLEQGEGQLPGRLVVHGDRAEGDADGRHRAHRIPQEES